MHTTTRLAQTLLILLLALANVGVGSALAAPNPADVNATVTYGLRQDASDTTTYTAVAVPSVTADDVVMVSAVFTFLLPAGTVIEPAVPTAPATGRLSSINGIWNAQKLTADLYADAGLDPARLEGWDVYQAYLTPGSGTPPVRAGEAVELFSLQVTDGCSGQITMLINDSALQQAILADAGANFNNQMTLRAGDTTAVYAGNEPAGATVGCPRGANFTQQLFIPMTSND